jgi:transcriptional regulator of arginine metabolism
LPVTGFLSIEFSGNFAVIKTVPGYASSIASRIDKDDYFEILATIAGDDTILVIPREGVNKNDVLNVLAMIMPEIKDNE